MMPTLSCKEIRQRTHAFVTTWRGKPCEHAESNF
jgi:hypothetical protein